MTMTDARLCVSRPASRGTLNRHDDRKTFPEVGTRDMPAPSTTHAAAAPLWNLTPQQWRVFLLVGKALSNKAIAHELNVAESTVKAHVSAIFKMAGCRNRTEAALLSQRVRFGLLDVTDEPSIGFKIPAP